MERSDASFEHAALRQGQGSVGQLAAEVQQTTTFVVNSFATETQTVCSGGGGAPQSLLTVKLSVSRLFPVGGGGSGTGCPPLHPAGGFVQQTNASSALPLQVDGSPVTESVHRQTQTHGSPRPITGVHETLSSHDVATGRYETRANATENAKTLRIRMRSPLWFFPAAR